MSDGPRSSREAVLDRPAVPPEEVPFSKGMLIRRPEALPVTW
ncbi:hypothetical protein ACIHCM_13410 [Streptomyces sp. NPDC052023]